MTELTKIVRRVTSARRHEKSKTRAVVISIEPPARVGCRLQGTRDTFRLDVETIYELAVLSHERAIEKRAHRIAKEESITLGKARVKARRILKGELQ